LQKKDSPMETMTRMFATAQPSLLQKSCIQKLGFPEGLSWRNNKQRHEARDTGARPAQTLGSDRADCDLF
jgi:hypothetical protein